MKTIRFIILFMLGVLQAGAQPKIKSYEYWFDHDVMSKVVISITPVSIFQLNAVIPTTGLPGGLHVFNVRFEDDSSAYSQVASSFFFKQYQGGGGAQNDMVAYEYWFDNNYASKVSNTIPASPFFQFNASVATAGVVPGLHVMNIRFRDSGGKWSQVASHFFYKGDQGGTAQNNLVECEYWYDQDIAGKVSIAISPQQQFNLLSNLATASLPVGLHVFNVRFKDESGKWSQVLSQFFTKMQSSQSTQKVITQYQYWFDEDAANSITQSVSPVTDYHFVSSVSTGNLPEGLHTYHVRFKDTNQLWSQVLTQFIYKLHPISPVNNVIVGYRYWTDHDFAAATYVQLSNPMADFHLNSLINMLNIPKGARVFNIQFRDTANRWSVVQTDSFFRTPLPNASFHAATTSFCDSGTVVFSNNSFDLDVFQWYFGDGLGSSDAAPVHTYTTPGSYAVQLIGTDTLMNLQDDTIQVGYITVHALPVVTATASTDTLCFGEATQLTGTGNATSYTWSNGVLNNQPFTPLASTMYTVTGSDGFCSSMDSILITVHALPVVTVAPVSPNDTVCDGAVMTLSGGGANTYAWNGPQTVLNATPFTATTSGVYTVTGTDGNLCSNTSSVAITVHAIPVFSLGVDTGICQGTVLTLSQPYNGASCVWSNSSTADTLNVNAPGSYACQVTLNGCSYADTIQVSLDSLPVARFGYALSNSTITITDSSKFATTLKYYFGDGDSSSLANPVHTYSTNGNYTVKQIVYNDCGTDTLTRNLAITTGLNDQTSQAVLIYPVPARNHLYIDLTAFDRTSVSVHLVDLKGNTVMKAVYTDAVKVIQLDVHALSTGTYLLRLQVEGQTYIQRIALLK